MTTPPPVTLDQWLTYLYNADRRNILPSALDSFRAAIAADTQGLGAQAQTQLTELNAMIAARGEQACDYSTKYRNYLQAALQ